jgi:hypothetical protein
MKATTVLVLMFVAVTLFSCHRDYTCECTTYGPNPSHADVTRYEKLGRIPSEDATNTCRKIKINRQYDTCTLTSIQ